jgi:hypothetical protein
MKKVFILLLSITSLSSFFISCSKDEITPQNPQNPQNPETFILPRKIVIDRGSGNAETSTITYNGNKIVQIIDGEKSIYTYTGNLITKVEYYDGATLDGETTFDYLNDKLVTETETDYSVDPTTGVKKVSKTKTVYTHNTNGTILEESYKIDSTTGQETKNNRSTIYTYANGNLVKTITTSTDISTYTDFNGNLVTDTYVYKTNETYEYDNKNGLTKNILGFDKIISFPSSVNNIVKSTILRENSINGVTNPPAPATIRIYLYKYNSNGYPTEQKYDYTTYENNQPVVLTRTEQYFYE